MLYVCLYKENICIQTKDSYIGNLNMTIKIQAIITYKKKLHKKMKCVYYKSHNNFKKFTDFSEP